MDADAWPGPLKAPFPWFGGKSRAAHLVWPRFGDVAVYAEPFFGSGAVLLGRPGWSPGVSWVETVNDLDGFLANAWRAILRDPAATAHHADWPANEIDLHARHAWLTERRDQLTARLEGDPDYYDPKIAGWWLWGMACWIGGGFCSGDGPWHRVEVESGDMQLVHLGDAGRGVQRKRVHLGNAGQGVQRQLVHLGSAGQGVQRKRVHLGDGGDGLVAWFVALAARLARVRVCCGDWRRVLTPSALAPGVGGVRGIFLDPPYSAEAGRDMSCYGATDDGAVAHDVRAWCLEHGDETGLRIALCGYEGEHDELEQHGWSVISWVASGGMSRGEDSPGSANRFRERIWFSPGCVRPAGNPQLTLFDAPPPQNPRSPQPPGLEDWPAQP